MIPSWALLEALRREREDEVKAIAERRRLRARDRGEAGRRPWGLRGLALGLRIRRLHEPAPAAAVAPADEGACCGP